MKQHQSHAAICKRLKRAEGHLRSTIQMIESERPCLDLAQQLHAVESAISNAKKELIHDHMEHCLDSMEPKRALKEMRALAKYI
jgi:DNA-binding FrmR family transcriptional regulator